MYRKILNTPSPSGQDPSQPKRCKSILKRNESPSSSKDLLKTKACGVSGGSKSVKFMKSNSVQQATLRSKLNSWLAEKGKTPSRYFNLMYFDEQLSAKKKQDRSLPGRLSEDIVGQQVESLKKEEQNLRKELFKGCSKTGVKELNRKSTLIVRRNSSSNSLQDEAVKKENAPRRSLSRRSASHEAGTKPFSDSSNRPQPSPHDSSSKKQMDKGPSNDDLNDSYLTESSSQGSSKDLPITDCDIRNNLMSMLQECLTLFRAGCPSEPILSWLENMEHHIPQTQTCALFYACKAEIFSSDPTKMLDVFCQGVENKAEPCQVLTNAMKRLLTLHICPPGSMMTEVSNQSLHLSNPHLTQHKQNMDSPEFEDQHYHDLDDASPFQGRFGAEVMETHQGQIQTTQKSESKTPVNSDPINDDTFIILDKDSKRRSRKSYTTPIKDSRTVGHNADGTPYLGSSIKYTVSAATPIPGQSPESVPQLVVTPVRRSTRLSNRHPTPQALREIDSIWDLTLKEAETTMFSSNPAIEDS